MQEETLKALFYKNDLNLSNIFISLLMEYSE